MINIADLIDPEDPKGRTYREVNNAKNHKYSVGDLVQIETKARLFVSKLPRDCDGTPLYVLGCETGRQDLYGIPEEYITEVNHE